MKKFLTVMVLLLALTFTFTSCEKEEVNQPDIESVEQFQERAITSFEAAEKAGTLDSITITVQTRNGLVATGGNTSVTMCPGVYYTFNAGTGEYRYYAKRYIGNGLYAYMQTDAFDAHGICNDQ